MADLICDTNVFYNIAAGTVNPSEIKQAGHKLLLTPVSVLELISRVNKENFGIRQSAARAALEHSDEVLPDPETVLAGVWMMAAELQDVNWCASLQALSDAVDLADAVRRLNLPLVRGWRACHYENFESEMIGIVDQFVPGYADARLAGGFLNASKEQRASVNRSMSAEELRIATVLATRDRSWRRPAESIPAATEGQIAFAEKALDAYARMYSQYCLDVASTNYAPQPNDLGDLECFIYMQPGRLVATSERRWPDVATRAGLGSIVLDPQPL